MFQTVTRAPRRASRVKLGFGLLAGVLATLAAAQAPNVPSGAQSIAIQGGTP